MCRAGHQGFHTDWGENPVNLGKFLNFLHISPLCCLKAQQQLLDQDALLDPPQFSVCNSLWCLNDFTPENGSTRVLPVSELYICCCFAMTTGSTGLLTDCVCAQLQGSLT